MIDSYINKSALGTDSFLDVGGWLGNIQVNGYPLIGFFWNSFLLVLPFAFAYIFWRYCLMTGLRSRIEQSGAWLLLFIWLLFLPNTAYVITDVRHLSQICMIGDYYRVCPDTVWHLVFFFLYGVLGWMTMVLSLEQMRCYMSQVWGRRKAEYIIWPIFPLMSLGLLLGLVNRWNSWEILTSIMPIAESIFGYFSDLTLFVNWLIYTICLSILYIIGRKLFVKIEWLKYK